MCEEVTNILHREVCVYPYVQKSVSDLACILSKIMLKHQVMAVAHMTEIGFETRHRGMEVSRCHTYIEHAAHGYKEVEKCKNDFVEKEYWVPTIYEGFEDLIELDIPDAQKHCSSFGFDVPDTICRVSLIQFAKSMVVNLIKISTIANLPRVIIHFYKRT